MPLPDPASLRAEAHAEQERETAAAAAELAHQRALAAAQAPALRAAVGRRDFRFGALEWVFSKKDPAYLAAVPVYEAVVRDFVAQVRARGGYRVSAHKVDFESSHLDDARGCPTSAAQPGKSPSAGRPKPRRPKTPRPQGGSLWMP